MSSPNDERLTYSSYLKVKELIALQTPLASPVAHDEMLFIVIHQTYELWFKQVLFEMGSLIEYLNRDEMLAAFRLLDRICEIFRVLIQQVDILETMTPVDFNRFRAHLNPASGFQSIQFRQFELLSGASPADYQRFASLNPEWKDAINEAAERQSLRAAFFSALRRQNLIASEEHDDVLKGISRIYEDDKQIAMRSLCEYLIGFDEQVSLWRFRHVQMVERMIGMKHGTGGSLGVPYLSQTLKKRFFPELWEARTSMGGGAY